MLRGLRGWGASGAARAYATAPAPAMRGHWRQAAYCVVDLELSGLDPRRHEIISLGAVPIEEGRARLDGALSSLVAPTRPLAEEAIRVHGIRAADLDGAPPLAEAIEMLLGALAGRVLVAHHADVERAFLGPALRGAGVRLRGPIVDSALVGRLWLAQRDGALPRQLPLAELARRCGLPAHSPHTAIGDALTSAQVFLAAADHLDARRRQTLRELTRAGTRLRELAAYGLAPPVKPA